jgi:phosphatidate cytidylyltransferase
MLSISLLIFSLLLLATAVIEYQLATSTGNTLEIKNNRLRIHTWWLITGICLPVLYLSGWVITVFVYGLIYWAAYEFTKLIKLRINKLTISLFSSALISYHILTIVFNNLSALYFATPFIIILLSLGAFKVVIYTTRPDKLLVPALCITAIFSIELIRLMSKQLNYDAGLVILFLFFITAANDIFQYICGKMFGSTQLAPVISRHKTYEGAIGGLVLTSLLSMMVAPYVIEVSALVAFCIGALMATLGISGDLYISFLKRRANVKDAGTSLPGHGGLLDRIDSLLFTAPGFGLFITLNSYNYT